MKIARQFIAVFFRLSPGNKLPSYSQKSLTGSAYTFQNFANTVIKKEEELND
jgi:hypothetical protein